ncbi:MAG TPA: helix-turn-helix domain-containing protein [Candidatus Micrarchaeaceae archaeon]|nr:helix-turn-helix domain-containing protein [Candidatus Micrarchaeaceae archaeon]
MKRRFPRVRPEADRKAVALGERLRLARLRRGMTQAQLAARARSNRVTIARLERGETSVTLNVLLRVLDVLALVDEIDLIAKDDLMGQVVIENRYLKPRRAKQGRPNA